MRRSADRIEEERERTAPDGVIPPGPSAFDGAAPAQVAVLRSVGPDRAAAYIAGLQRGCGNAAVARMLTPAGPTLARQPLPIPGAGGSAKTPLPGWGSPVMGDDESVATFSPYATYKQPKSPVPQSSATFDADEGFTGTINIKQAGGEVQLAVDDLFVIDEFADEVVSHEYWASWSVTSNKWGELKIAKGRPRRGQTKGWASDPKEVQLTGLETEEHASEHKVVLKATFKGASSSSSPISVGQQGKKGGSVGGSLNDSKTYEGGTVTATFTLNIVVEDALLGPKAPPYTPRKLTLYYKEGKHLLDGRQTVALADFLKTYQKEYEALKTSDAADDKGRVKITAHASPKGRPQDNLDLADDRANEVRKRLEQLGVRPNNITHANSSGELAGSAKGEPAGNEATPSEQRVEVEIWEKRPEDE